MDLATTVFRAFGVLRLQYLMHIISMILSFIFLIHHSFIYSYSYSRDVEYSVCDKHCSEYKDEKRIVPSGNHIFGKDPLFRLCFIMIVMNNAIVIKNKMVQ